MTDTITTISKTITRTAGRKFLVIDAELRINDPRGLSAGFSITGALYEPHGTWSGAAQYRNGRNADVAGCIHDEILRFAPSLAPLVAVHLADPDGVPMHAEANGWHFYSGDARRWEEARPISYHNPGGLSDVERAARTLHVDAADVPAGLDREQFAAFVESLRPRWAEMARVARDLLASL